LLSQKTTDKVGGSLCAPGMTHTPFFWHELPEVKLPAVTGRKGYANKARAVPEMGCLKEA